MLRYVRPTYFFLEVFCAHIGAFCGNFAFLTICWTLNVRPITGEHYNAKYDPTQQYNIDTDRPCYVKDWTVIKAFVFKIHVEPLLFEILASYNQYIFIHRIAPMYSLMVMTHVIFGNESNYTSVQRKCWQIILCLGNV